MWAFLIPFQGIITKVALTVALVAVVFAAGYFKGRNNTVDKYEAVLHEQRVAYNALKVEAAGISQSLRSERDQLRREKDAQLFDVNTRLTAAVDSLRQRPQRAPSAPGDVPQPPRAECKGATGSELAREDGEFLAREAARAARVSAALGECYAAYDRAKAAIDQFNSQPGDQP